MQLNRAGAVRGLGKGSQGRFLGARQIDAAEAVPQESDLGLTRDDRIALLEATNAEVCPGDELGPPGGSRGIQMGLREKILQRIFNATSLKGSAP
jgi:hypothetical protein